MLWAGFSCPDAGRPKATYAGTEASVLLGFAMRSGSGTTFSSDHGHGSEHQYFDKREGMRYTFNEEQRKSGKLESVASDVARALTEGGGKDLEEALVRLRYKARESARGSRDVCDAAVPLLSSVLCSRWASNAAKEEAAATLLLLPLPAATRRALACSHRLVTAITWLLRRGSSIAVRAAAASFLELLAAEQRDLKLALGSSDGTLEGLVDLLHLSDAAAQAAALRSLVCFCSVRRNRVKAIERGAVAALLALLRRPGAEQGGIRECAMALLEMLCGCAEGRDAFVAQGPPAVECLAQNMSVAEDAATQSAVRTFLAVCRHCPDPVTTAKRALHAGVPSRLSLILQAHYSCPSSQGAHYDTGNVLRLLSILHQHCPSETDRIQGLP